MTEKQLDVLQMEYRTVSDALEKHALTTYQALAIGAVVGSALALYKDVGDGQARLGGIVLIYGIVMAVVGLSFMHSVVCGMGLRLIEIEIRINRATGTPHWQGICWYSRFIGSLFRVFPGYRQAVILMTILGITAVGLGFLKGWEGLSKDLGLAPWQCDAALLIPLAILLFSLLHLVAVAFWTRHKKAALLERFSLRMQDQPPNCSLWLPDGSPTADIVRLMAAFSSTRGDCAVGNISGRCDKASNGPNRP